MTETKSTHKAEVVAVVLQTHPNADTLSIVRIWGYTVVVRTAEWQYETLGVYITPDSVVPDHPYFNFLAGAVGKEHPMLRDKDRRITARKFRGVMSEGLLIPLSHIKENWLLSWPSAVAPSIGTDVAGMIGITRYEPPVKADTTQFGRGRGLHHVENETGPPSYIAPIYDLESWQRYGAETFEDGEYVTISEKIDGTNFRACYHIPPDSSLTGHVVLTDPGKFYVGSHRTWKRQVIPAQPRPWYIRALELIGLRATPQGTRATDVYSRTARLWPQIGQFCRAHPNHTLYGEVYGDVSNGSGAKYGLGQGETRFAAFDVRKPDGTWMDVADFLELMVWAKLDSVPSMAGGFYSDEFVRQHISGPSFVPGANHIREGIVVRSAKDGRSPTGERKCLKAVSPKFLEKMK
jgi:RNA ligase (TIGR02306 family)